MVLLRLLALFLAFAIASAAAFALVGPTPAEPVEPAPGPMLLACLLDSAVLALLAARLRGRFLGASLTAFVALFGPMSFMTQIESIFFIRDMATADALRVMAAGGVIAAIVAPLAVRLFASREPAPDDEGPTLALPRGAAAWLPRLAIIALLYLGLYFGFGYFIAWSQPAVRAFYGGDDPAGFVPHMAALLRDDPGLLLFQGARALAWTGIALSVLVRFRGSRPLAALVVGLVFSVFMNANLLLPNPFMPENVRMIHLLETASSNLLFGALLVAVLTVRRAQPAPEHATA